VRLQRFDANAWFRAKEHELAQARARIETLHEKGLALLSRKRDR
jgi:hypothetical protein